MNSDAVILGLNERHAVVRLGGRTAIITEDTDPVLNRTFYAYGSFQDIRNLYSNRQVIVGEDRNGDPIWKSLGDAWLEHPMRRQYDGITFSPGRDVPGWFNLWRGFAVQPRAGDWSLLSNHVYDNICCGNAEHFWYLLNWMAATVQRAGEPAEVAVALRGKRGTGKGVFGRELGALFGHHFVHIAHARHLTQGRRGLCQDRTDAAAAGVGCQ
ncbi:MAG: hypothetical protein DMG04_13550 [Acidobacteria bacterium]|nr:MAG: hypothetical protein DMG04_13550 [Acidobacteriota bacterium]PYR08780.1 MAG: hypothetical protein DMF99_17680 [Acidobacteriota bacterium]